MEHERCFLGTPSQNLTTWECHLKACLHGQGGTLGWAGLLLPRCTYSLLRGQVIMLPPWSQSLKVLICQHLLEQHPFYLVPPWKQVCSGGSISYTLELLFLLQISHRKATKMPRKKKKKTSLMTHKLRLQTFPSLTSETFNLYRQTFVHTTYLKKKKDIFIISPEK